MKTINHKQYKYEFSNSLETKDNTKLKFIYTKADNSISKDTDFEKVFFEGYASVFNNIDAQDEMIVPGAFAESLSLRGNNIKLLWQHDASSPIGLITEIKEDNFGLFIRGYILLCLQQGKETIELIASKTITGLSIGYNVIDSYHKTIDNYSVHILSKIDLWEVSVVTFPCNSESNIYHIDTENTVNQQIN